MEIVIDQLIIDIEEIVIAEMNQRRREITEIDNLTKEIEKEL
jgi:hypothetical protein